MWLDHWTRGEEDLDVFGQQIGILDAIVGVAKNDDDHDGNVLNFGVIESSRLESVESSINQS